MHDRVRFSKCALILLALVPLTAAEHNGRVTFGGLPVPGATVTASRGDQKMTAITDQQGAYLFQDLTEGRWTISVEMTGFAPARQDVQFEPEASVAIWELKMLGLEELHAAVQAPSRSAAPRPEVTEVASTAPPAPVSNSFGEFDSAELDRRAADGFLINGTANNGAASPFSQSQAFGNSRRNRRTLYNGNLGLILGNSTLDARPFSLTGQPTPRPDYSRVQGVAAFAGPLRIPRLLRNGPNLLLNYQWIRNRNVSTQSALMPALDERRGDFSRTARQIFDPSNSSPFPGNVIPASRISPQASSLLRFYPVPNFDSSRYNYQVPLVGALHQDNFQSRFNQRLPRRNQIYGNASFESTRTDSPNVFSFLDSTSSLGINSAVNWLHMFNPRFYIVAGYQFSRLAAAATPFFAYRRNISSEAGITGNNQEPVNWGPPALSFSSGIAELSDARSSLSRDQTSGVSLEIGSIRGRHNLTFGGDFRRQQFNLLSQEDPRGTFVFTGASTQASVNGVPVPGSGSDLAGFLLGIPDASSIAFGNADKYFRTVMADAYVNDDFRIRSGLTVNFGIRWEYGSPITELYGRLVNLDVAPGFAAVEPVVAASATGPLTGRRYPGSLIQPDRNNLAPRVGFAWRPFSASSMVIRGGYGIYYDTSVYQSIATRMAQQSPLSTSLRVQNSESNPLTLANGFNAAPSITRNTFAIDPDFRTGYSKNWQVSVQRDLPRGLVVIATYLGVKGTRAQQQFLPNTFPLGAAAVCPACPTGFAYLTSNGNSTRQAGQIEVRRRLRSGFTATLQYTLSKSIDNAALGGRNQGGSLIAQNWLDLRAERGRSNFDQRHLVNVLLQYTTGMGIRGGTLLSGWRGSLFKEWTFSTQITAGTGLPLTPVYPAAVAGTGVTTSIRPDYTGAPLYEAPSGLFLNPTAYTAPAPGHWGNAGRNSITGPSQFTLNSSLGRTFRLGDRLNLDLRLDAANVLNHPVFPSWITTITSAQFGLPGRTNPMRSVETTVRLRF
jgi:hypothetical protein